MKYILALTFFLAGCSDPTVKCDYCHVMREGAKRYTCDKCKMTHSACDVDRAVMHYTETGSGRFGPIYSATSLQVCPPPEEDPHAEIYPMPESQKTYSAAVVAGALLCGFLMGFNLRPRRDPKPMGKV